MVRSAHFHTTQTVLQLLGLTVKQCLKPPTYLQAHIVQLNHASFTSVAVRPLYLVLVVELVHEDSHGIFASATSILGYCHHNKLSDLQYS